MLTALGEAAEVEIPPVMVERRVQDRLETIARTFARRGMRLEQYLQMTGQSIEEVVADLRPDAEASARQELALKALRRPREDRADGRRAGGVRARAGHRRG